MPTYILLTTTAGLSSPGTIKVLSLPAFATAGFLGRFKAHTNFGKG
jgi:hypothetical protein